MHKFWHYKPEFSRIKRCISKDSCAFSSEIVDPKFLDRDIGALLVNLAVIRADFVGRNEYLLNLKGRKQEEANYPCESDPQAGDLVSGIVCPNRKTTKQYTTD